MWKVSSAHTPDRARAAAIIGFADIMCDKFHIISDAVRCVPLFCIDAIHTYLRPAGQLTGATIRGTRLSWKGDRVIYCCNYYGCRAVVGVPASEFARLNGAFIIDFSSRALLAVTSDTCAYQCWGCGSG